MIITVTYLRLISVWGFFRLSWQGLKILLQLRKQRGFLKMKNTGFGYHHYTLSAWESAEDAKAFARSGAHLQAMKSWRSLAVKVKVHTYQGAQLPSWAEAKSMVPRQS